MNNISRLLESVSKEYSCDICGESYRTHREAVKCADKCLIQKEKANQKIHKVSA